MEPEFWKNKSWKKLQISNVLMHIKIAIKLFYRRFWSKDEKEDEFLRHLRNDVKFMHHNKYAYKTTTCLLFSSTIEDAFLCSTPIVLFRMCPQWKVTIGFALITAQLYLKRINYFLLQYTLKYFLCSNHHDKNSIKIFNVVASS